MVKSKRERAAELILAGGATKDSLAKDLVVNRRALDNILCNLRLTKRYPYVNPDKTLQLMDEETFKQRTEEDNNRKKIESFYASKKYRKKVYEIELASDRAEEMRRIFKDTKDLEDELVTKMAELTYDLHVLRLERYEKEKLGDLKR